MPRTIAGLLIVFAALLLLACGGDDDTSSGADATQGPTAIGDPTDNATATAQPTEITPAPAGDTLPVYLALGDSLSAGIGASNPLTTSWVALVHSSLPDWDLINLGIPGDTSDDLLNGGSLGDGIGEIQQRKADDKASNEVQVITLEIGGNDLLNIYFDLVIPGDCPSVVESLERPMCVEALTNALATYRANLRETLRRLTEAAPGVPLFLMTLYNPFSGGASHVDQLGVLSLEGQDGTPFPSGLNDAIREEGAAAGVTVVEWYELFLGKQSEYIAQDLIHPNDTGQAVMADAVKTVMAQAGLPVVD
ncbi:MAG: GDSL-type esterase/lipase family protein [Dehalococcoidia bacterium]